MTALELITQPWNCITDRPNVGYPHRARALAQAVVTNENGIAYETRVLTNRTKTRFWLEAHNNHWLRMYRTTTSKRIAESWVAVIQEATR